MGKNGGSKHDTILTLEEALIRFKRKREASLQGKGAHASESTVHADLSATVMHESQATTEGARKKTTELSTAIESVLAQSDEVGADTPASADIVAVIDGIPRTLEELERIAAAEQAYHEDFPEGGLHSAEAEDEAEADDLAAGDMEVAQLANRHGLIRDYAFTAMGSALMVLVAFLMTRVPIVKHRPNMMAAQSIATPALKAGTPTDQEDLISTLVIVPDAEVEEASAVPRVRTDVLEQRIRHTLRGRAFTDIGVSVSKKGDAYLAGEVYSLAEAQKIARIVHRVNGVGRVHFLHPDVHSAQGPAYFGVMMAFAPDVWGAKVRAVIIGSPADKAGLAPGDVISEFDGKTIPDAKTLNDLIAQYSPGKRVQFRAWHNGQPEYLVARFGETTSVASRELMTVAGPEVAPAASHQVMEVPSRENEQVASSEMSAAGRN